MLPKVSLLEELRKGGYEASLITTFNAYFPFYEEVILRRLTHAGVRQNVLLMDGQQYAASMHHYPPRYAGRRYTLLPLQVSGAFHPKLIFLVGKNKGLIAIGSHNMTLAGFGFNRELTNVVRIKGADDLEGIALAREVWIEVEHWLEGLAYGVPRQVVEMVRRVRDVAPWMNAEAESNADLKLLAGRPGGVPLWDQLTGLVDGEVAHVSISGAFFDQELQFLNCVIETVRPNQLTVGIDPNTVQMPSSAKAMPGVSLVRANLLGLEADANEPSRQYLHAKGILVRQKNGGAIFASGSANPSAQAWMAGPKRGNVELMLALRGRDAIATAEAIGFTAIADMAPLDDADWQAIAHNQNQQEQVEPQEYRMGIAVAQYDHVLIDRRLLEDLRNPEFTLIRTDGVVLVRSKEIELQSELAAIAFSPEKLEAAFSVNYFEDKKLTSTLLLHHSREVEEQARTGAQKQFKDALLSLETDAPNIELLINCLEKIMNSEEKVPISAVTKAMSPREKGEEHAKGDLGSLAIDVAQIKRRRKSIGLNHSGDFAYLLDALIYRLRLIEDKSIEELDRYGRTEEEQVQADDEEVAEHGMLSAHRQAELLKLCHAKVRTVVNRMVDQLKAYCAGKQPLANVLVRLLAVLAVLRELRRCDGRVTWVEKGKTTVEKEQRLRLFEEAMLSLFEGDASLLKMEDLAEDFQISDEVARIKGLLLWLAWDCGLILDLTKPFMESLEQRHERLRRNAMVLALAQMICADEVVIDEARQSIGSLTSSEMGWLMDVVSVANQCESLRQGNIELGPADKAGPGDIAMHKRIRGWVIRVVASNSGEHVSLVRLSREKDRLAYTPEHLAVTQFRYGS